MNNNLSPMTSDDLKSHPDEDSLDIDLLPSLIVDTDESEESLIPAIQAQLVEEFSNVLRNISEGSGKEDTPPSTPEAAPFDLILDFMSAVIKEDFESALQKAKQILIYEPTNTTIEEYLPVLMELIQLDSEDDESESEDESSSESSDDSSGEYVTAESEGQRSDSEDECHSSESGCSSAEGNEEMDE